MPLKQNKIKPLRILKDMRKCLHEKSQRREDKVFIISAIPNLQIYHPSKVTDIVNHGYLWLVFTL